MIEIFEWLTAEPSMWATAGKWACVAAVTVPCAAIGRLALDAHRTDQKSKGRSEKLAEVVPMPRPKTARKSVPVATAATVTAVKLAEESGDAKVLPLLPRAEREALRAGGWS